MKTNRIFPGLLFLFFGVVFLLNNFGYLDFHWSNVFRLWPIILIMVGLNLIFSNNRSPWATFIKIVVIIGGLTYILFGGIWNRAEDSRSWNLPFEKKSRIDRQEKKENKSVTKLEGKGNFNISFTPGTQLAVLNINGGATKYELNASTPDLFKAETHEFYSGFKLDHRTIDSVQILDFNMKGEGDNKWNFKNGTKSNKAIIWLNTQPEWEVNIAAGASELDFDLSKFKVKKLKIEGGAASFDIKLGEPLTSTQVDIQTGVSETVVKVPAAIACRIVTDAGLSSKSFEGFTTKNSNTFETENFESAPKKIFIYLKGGVSEFKVKRY
jgi:hypothetical protein